MPTGWRPVQCGPPAGVGWDWLNQRGFTQTSATTRPCYDNSYPADYMIWYQAHGRVAGRTAQTGGTGAVEICVVSLSGVDITWRCHAMAQYWDQLVNNAFGNYRSVLENVTLNAAMGLLPPAPVAARGRENPPRAANDENYAREVMQLIIHRVGRTEHRQDQRGTAGNTH